MRDRSVLAGSLLAGLLASACCIGPLVLGVLGLGALGLGTALEPWRPWLLGMAAGLLALGFYLAYRPQRQGSCDPGETCASRPGSRRSQRILLWIVTALTVAAATYPNWSTVFSRHGGDGWAGSSTSVVTLDVTGMTCPACAVSIERELEAVSGVSTAHVDFERGRAIVEVDAPAPDSRSLVAAVERAGYRGAPYHDRAPASGSLESRGRDSLEVLDQSLEPLLSLFNAGQGRSRFLAILSPRCPACVHGADAIRRAILDRSGPGSPSIFIVWTPMVVGDDEASARVAMESLRSARVRHYYDAENRVGTAFRRDVFPGGAAEMRSSVPSDHFFSSALRRRRSDQPEWDIYLFFDPGVRWENSAPRPSRWIRQAARFGQPGGDLKSLMWKNSYRAAPVEGDLTAELSALASRGR